MKHLTMANSNAKGDRAERELVNELDSRGFAVMRAPSSGSATTRELPDVLAGDGLNFYAFEAKASARSSAVYLNEQEIIDLRHFATAFGAKPRIAVRFDYTDWAFFDPGDVYRTGGGNYRVKHDDATARDVTRLGDL